MAQFGPDPGSHIGLPVRGVYSTSGVANSYTNPTFWGASSSISIKTKLKLIKCLVLCAAVTA